MRLTRCSSLLLAILPVVLSAQRQTPLKLWYDQPAANWNEALPVGNGRLAAMIFGSPSTEYVGPWYPFVLAAGGFSVLYLLLLYLYKNKIFVKV
jgi:hypothetical protein